MQSHNYVPGVSGWKLDNVTGVFEINSAKISVGGLPEQPQMVTVTAAEWAASDLPESAFDYYALIGSEITKIHAQYRDSAKITTQDESYDPDFADIRTKLTYQRPETAEEAAARMEVSRGMECSIKKEGDRITFSYGGRPRIVLGNLEKTDEKPETPFAVDGDQVILTQAFIDSLKMSANVKTSAAGQMFMAGVGIGLDEAPIEKVVDALGRTACDSETGASKVLDQISKLISTTELAQSFESLKVRIEHEAGSRACADNALSCRISAVEAGLNSLRAKQ